MSDAAPPTALTSKFLASTTIPDTAQYKRADWSGQCGQSAYADLASAEDAFAKNKSASYFFRTRIGFTLESTTGSPRSFATDDTVFFSGSNLWLGSALGMADTHLAAEVYDTDDEATRKAITTAIRDSMWIGGVDTRGGTREKPKTVTMGFVFCEFADKKGSTADIARLKDTLLGASSDAGSTVQKFVRDQSHGRVTITAETHPTWVALAKKYADYVEKHPAPGTDTLSMAAVLAEVDAAIDFPASWDVVVFAFPDETTVVPTNGTRTADQERAASYMASAAFTFRSGFIGRRDVDTKPDGGGAQSLATLFIAPTTYADPHCDLVTAHELMHALGLPDLYSDALRRSYGWSIMSAYWPARQLTGFEKLALGWDDLANYRVLKRGLLVADDLVEQTATDGFKGIVVLPDHEAGRDTFYYVQLAPAVGRTAGDLVQYAKDNPDRGLLALIVRTDARDGRIIPLVAARADSVTETYGGASQAPFRGTTAFTNNGVFSFATPKYPTDQPGRTVSRVVGVDAGYQPLPSAVSLRENEAIAAGDDTFRFGTDGAFTLNGLPCLDADGAPVEAPQLAYCGYGFCAFVDQKTGQFHVAASTTDKALPADIKKSYPATPATTTAAAGTSYFLRVESTAGVPSVVVRRRTSDGATVVDHVLFTAVPIMPGWSVSADGATLKLDDAGNLSVRKTVGDSFVTGSYQQYNSLLARGIRFTADGRMLWLDAQGKTLKTFPDDSGRADAKTFTGAAGQGPFTLGLKGDAKTLSGDVVVRDAKGTTLYTVMSYRGT